jgi:hypothetical protein
MFLGLRIEIVGYSKPWKLASAKSTSTVPANAVIRSAEMKAAVNVCFFTVSPNH